MSSGLYSFQETTMTTTMKLSPATHKTATETMAASRVWLQYLDDDGQWDFPGDPSACAFATPAEAETARVDLIATCPEYADVADWRTVESVDMPGNVGSYADVQRARARCAQ
jgi:hypothetical protein